MYDHDIYLKDYCINLINTMFHYGTTWAIGAINGYMLPEHGLPTGYKYGTIALASGIQLVKAIGSDAFKDLLPRRAASTLLTVVLGLPFFVGAVFCTGSYMGKSTRYCIEHTQFSQFQHKSPNQCE
jgi:hypothetical protein